MPDQHAYIGPSGYEIWSHCPVSPRLCAGEGERDTVYSKEGTLAHSTAETLLNWCLDFGFGTCPSWDYVQASYEDSETALHGALLPISEECSENGFDFDEMLNFVWNGYAAHVFDDYCLSLSRDESTILKVETRLDLSDFIPFGFGTSDAIIVTGESLYVYDLKYGKGVRVFAKDNGQMRCYALGAYLSIAETYPVRNVATCILQPRLNHISTEHISAVELYTWGLNVLAPAASAAWNGEGQPMAGPHCKFCKVQGRCKALMAYTDAVVSSTEPALMRPTEIASVLDRADTIEAWLKSVKEYALKSALDGGGIPGYKIVAGRSIRRFTDPNAVRNTLTDAGFAPSDYLKPSELKTIGDLEKLLGKKQFATILGEYVEKPEGKPTLVKADDYRTEYNNIANDLLS